MTFRLKLLVMAAFVAFASPAFAQRAADMPDGTKVPALADFMRQPEAHAYFMGQESGLYGWFITMSENRVQIAYTTPDGQRLIIGAIFNADHSSVTEAQLVALREREPAVNKLFTNTVEQAKQQLVKTSGMDRILKNLDPKSKGDQLYLELAQMFHVQEGSKDAPLLFMVIDPNCPHCHNVWKQLAPLVAKDQLQVRLLPVGILGPDSVRMAGMLLSASDPAAKWAEFAHADYDAKVLDGTPDTNNASKVDLNRAVFNKWNLQATPFIAYRSKAGGIKVVTEEPKDVKALVADIAPIPAADAQ